MSHPNAKLPKPLGRIPTLQFCRPSELRIDPAYQRDVANGPSQALIRKIAQTWNWDLCLPLVVARRVDLTERLFVIDGQHRLEAARLRGDIDQLPCVIVNYETPADEAAGFVSLNQQRRPLSKLDLFKAAVASKNPESVAIVAAMTDCGLSLAPHSNPTAWKPGMVANIGGIEQAWRRYGPLPATAALRVLAAAYPGQVLQYAGTIFPGIAAVCADEFGARKRLQDDRFEKFVSALAVRSQSDWRIIIQRTCGEEIGISFAVGAEKALRAAWSKASGDPLPPAGFAGQRWCNQCDGMVTHSEVQACRSRHCSLKEVA